MQVGNRASLSKQNVDPNYLISHDRFMEHSKGFLAVVEAARNSVNEITTEQAHERDEPNTDK